MDRPQPSRDPDPADEDEARREDERRRDEKAAQQPSAPPNPPRTTTGKITSPKFGSAGSGGAELEPGPERN